MNYKSICFILLLLLSGMAGAMEKDAAGGAGGRRVVAEGSTEDKTAGRACGGGGAGAGGPALADDGIQYTYDGLTALPMDVLEALLITAGRKGVSPFYMKGEDEASDTPAVPDWEMLHIERPIPQPFNYRDNLDDPVFLGKGGSKGAYILEDRTRVALIPASFPSPESEGMKQWKTLFAQERDGYFRLRHYGFITQTNPSLVFLENDHVKVPALVVDSFSDRARKELALFYDYKNGLTYGNGIKIFEGNIENVLSQEYWIHLLTPYVIDIARWMSMGYPGHLTDSPNIVFYQSPCGKGCIARLLLYDLVSDVRHPIGPHEIPAVEVLPPDHFVKSIFESMFHLRMPIVTREEEEEIFREITKEETLAKVIPVQVEVEKILTALYIEERKRPVDPYSS